MNHTAVYGLRLSSFMIAEKTNIAQLLKYNTEVVSLLSKYKRKNVFSQLAFIGP